MPSSKPKKETLVQKMCRWNGHPDLPGRITPVVIDGRVARICNTCGVEV